MKKTPIIAGIVGIGILGGAYLGGLYVSGNKAMNALRQMAVNANETAGVDYVQLQEERGLFSSTAHIVIQEPMTKNVKVDSHLIFHHGVFSTDIGGKLMFNNDQFQQIDFIRNNDGLDVLGHINTFGSKGNFIQAAISHRIDDKKALLADNEASLLIRAESGVNFDQATLDKLRSVIAKGMNGQSPVGADGRGDGKESNMLMSLQVKGPGASVDVSVPVLYQENSHATDASMFMSVNYNGQDVLKSYGIDAIDGVSHGTNDKYKLGSYARFDLHGMFAFPPESAHSPFSGQLAGLGLLAEVNESGIYTLLKADSLDARADGQHVAAGPVSFKLSMDSGAYGKLLDDSRAMPAMPAAERLAVQKVWQTYLPDLHLEVQNLRTEGYDDEGDEEQVSIENMVFAVTRDIKQPFTHITSDIRGVNGGEMANGDISLLVTLDQSIIDIFMRMSAIAQQTQFHPSNEQVQGMKLDALAFLQTSPRIVLDKLQVSNARWSHAVNASGEVAVVGNTIRSLSSFGATNITAHLTASGLPSDQLEQLDEYGVYGLSSDKPVTIDFHDGELLINGKSIN